MTMYGPIFGITARF